MKRSTHIRLLRLSRICIIAVSAFALGRESSMRRIPHTTDFELSALDYKFRTFEASELLMNIIFLPAIKSGEVPQYTFADFRQHEQARLNALAEEPGSRSRGASLPSNQTMHQHRMHLRATPRPRTGIGAQSNGRRDG